MKLSDKLIKDFADAINKKESSKKKVSTQVQGTVIKKTSKDDICVQLDGSQSATPVKMGVGAEVGDRVLVNIEEHTATIVGNISTPAYASTADNYIRYDENGLAVGKLVNGEPSGAYCIMDSNEPSFSIKEKNENGTDISIATFGKDSINLGLSDSCTISFCGDRAAISYEYGTDEVWIHAPGTISLMSHSEGMMYSFVSVSPGELILDTFGVIRLCSDNGVYTGDPDNNEAVLSTQDFMVHRVNIKVGSTAAGGYKTINTTLEVPSGHRVMALLGITIAHKDIFKLTEWSVDPNTNQFQVTWVNDGSKAYTGLIYLRYLTMPTTYKFNISYHSDISVS